MNRIRECRKNKKLTLKQLSKELAKNNFEISADALGKYERGEREPKLETWVTLADFFDVPVNYLQGDGWSQNDVADFFIYVATYNDNEDVRLPSGITMQKGKIAKYGFDKETIDDESDVPTAFYNDVLADYLVKFKVKQLREDYGITTSEEKLKAKIKGDVEGFSDEYLTADDEKKVLKIAIDKIKNPIVNVVIPLKAAITEKLWHDISQLDPLHDTFGDPDFSEFINSLDKGTLSLARQELINTIPLLHDFKFLSNLSPFDIVVDGPAPEYEIADRLISDVKIQHYKSQQDYFESDPYAATEKMISSLKMDNRDRQTLINIIEFLIDENSDLKDRLDELENQVHYLENPNDDPGGFL